MGPQTTSRNAVCGLTVAVLAMALAATPAPGFAQTAAMEASARQVGRACRGDAMKLCAGMRPGDGKILSCLESRFDQLSPACKAKIPEAIALRDQASGGTRTGN